MNLTLILWKIIVWFNTYDLARLYECIDFGIGVRTSNLRMGDEMPVLRFKKLFRSKLQIMEGEKRK